LNYSTLTNEELLSKYQDLDIKAFEEFFRRNGPIIFSFLKLRLRNNSEAEEVLQETFLRVHKYILKYDTDQSALNWLFAIAKNCALDLIKKRKKQASLKDEALFVHEMSKTEINYQKNAQTVLKDLLDKLSPADRKLIEGRYLEEKSYDLLAQAQDVSPAGMRQRISRLISKIKLMN